MNHFTRFAEESLPGFFTSGIRILLFLLMVPLASVGAEAPGLTDRAAAFPEIVCPPNITVDCTSPTTPEYTGQAKCTTEGVTDDNGNPIEPSACEAVKITFADDTKPGACAGKWTIYRTWSALDQNGNGNTCLQVITVVDQSPPVPTKSPADLTLSCGEEVPPPMPLSAHDKCSGEIKVNPVDKKVQGECGDYTIIRTWTFDDGCGNTSSVSQKISVSGGGSFELPLAPKDLVVACGEAVPPAETLIAIDDCGRKITGKLNEQTFPGECGDYILIRTWTFENPCGESSRLKQRIDVRGGGISKLPLPPEDRVVPCKGIIPPAETLTAIDDCGREVIGKLTEQTVVHEGCGDYTIIRTWTFDDGCTDLKSVSQKITVQGGAIPELPTPPEDAIVPCKGIIPAAEKLTAKDKCGRPITGELTEKTLTGECGGHTIYRTWTFPEACGNIQSVGQKVTVLGGGISKLPLPPKDLAVACNEEIPPAATLVAQNGCGWEIPGKLTEKTLPGECGDYTIVRTWTFTDGCGNSKSVSQKVTVTGGGISKLPLPPKDLVVACGEEVPPAETLVAIDDCGRKIPGKFSEKIAPGECGDYTINRFWTFTDGCGNSSSVNQQVTVITRKLGEVPTGPKNLSLSCASDVPPAADLTAIDNCGDKIIVSPIEKKYAVGECPNDFSLDRTWIFHDGCGGEIYIRQTIVVRDETPPVLPAAPKDLFLSCTSDVPPPADLTALDDCDGKVVGILSEEKHAFGECPNNYTLKRTWTFTDFCGNSSSINQTIRVIDRTAPVPPTAPADLTLACASDVPEAEELTAVDDCNGDITVAPTTKITPGTCRNDFTMVRTWTFTDACGNTSSVNQTITVRDDTPPVPPKIPLHLEFSCADNVPAAKPLTAVDDCDGNITVTPISTYHPGVCANEFMLIRKWTFSDTCGNTTSVEQLIEVMDLAPPVPATAPADLTLACASDVPPPVKLTATDNCDGDITVNPTTQITPGACLNDFTLVRTWTFTDTCGHTSSVSQTITVLDTLAPVPQAGPADLNLACASDVPPPVKLTATDNCDGDITVSPTVNITPGACLNDFTMVRTWTFSDTCGNTSSVSQTIIVLDTLAPLPQTAPADLRLACASDVPPPVKLTATDNCDGDITVSPTVNITPGACLNDFTMVRTWTFSDTCGNTSSVSQTIIVVDTIAPVLQAAPADLTLACADDVPPPVNLTATDNCDGDITVSPTTQITPGACLNDFTMVRTWTFSDTCGNTSSISQTITVMDTLAPVPQAAPADLSLACASDVPPPVKLTASDNCEGDITVSPTVNITPGACLNDFTMVRTWTFSDTCGNTSSVSQSITVLDTLAPVPQAVPVDLSLECASDVPPPVKLTATDNCDGDITVSPTTQITPGACLNDFTMVRTWTFTDTCGNTSSISQTITVLDTDPPQLVVPADIPDLSCTDSTTPSSTGVATATDNCDGDLIPAYTDEIVDVAGTDCYTIKRTWTVADTCGNIASDIQIITVADTVPPAFLDCPADVVLACNEDIPEVADPQATDNCNDDVEVVYNGEIRDDSCSEDYYTLTRTWTATDNCGNTATCEQLITVNTKLTDPCYSLTLEQEYDEAANTTRFTWELCLTGDDCQDISNIRFSIPCDLPKSHLLDGYSSIDGLIVGVNGKTGRCDRYDVQYDGFQDRALYQEPGGCVSFSYLLQGDLRDYETDVSIKSGNEKGLGFDDVGENCSCTKATDEPAPSEMTHHPLRFDGAVGEGIADVQLFPNPTADIVTLRFQNPSGAPVMVQVFDATGRLQFARRLVTSEGFNQLEVDVTSLPSGLYRMVLTPDGGTPHIRPFIRLHR